MTFTIIAFHADDTARMESARHIRQTVFRDEQGVSAAEEWDGKDSICEHFLVLDQGRPVGCARVRPYGPGIFKIERVAVLRECRHRGAGAAIMVEIIRRLGPATAVLNAQVSAADFYSGLGFVGEGEIFEEADMPHIHMVRRPHGPPG